MKIIRHGRNILRPCFEYWCIYFFLHSWKGFTISHLLWGDLRRSRTLSFCFPVRKSTKNNSIWGLITFELSMWVSGRWCKTHSNATILARTQGALPLMQKTPDCVWKLQEREMNDELGSNTLISSFEIILTISKWTLTEEHQKHHIYIFRLKLFSQYKLCWS